MITCKKCGRTLDESLFRKDPRLKSGYRSVCKECRPYTDHDRAVCRAYRQSHREQAAEHMRAYRARHREKLLHRNRDKRLTDAYGIGTKEWDGLFEHQGRRCAICGVAHSGKQNWRTDHDHKTGEVRGILCNLCNTMLGLFDDDVVRMGRAVEYLRNGGAL